jgi:hypothetical protein
VSQPQKEGFWFTSLPGTSAVYCNFRRYDDLQRHMEELLRFVEQQKAEKLVVDLRQNAGGYSKRGLKDLIEPIQHNSHVKKSRNSYAENERCICQIRTSISRTQPDIMNL